MKQSVSAGLEQQERQSQTVVVHRTPANESYRFVNNRPETVAQRQLVNTIHASPQMIAQRKVAQSLHSSPHMATQRASIRSMQNPSVQLQGKFAAESLTQRVQSPYVHEDSSFTALLSVNNVPVSHLVQRMTIPNDISGSVAPIKTEDIDIFVKLLASSDIDQLIRIIVYMENHPDHNGFDVVYAYDQMWNKVNNDFKKINEIIDHINPKIPRPLHKLPVKDTEPRLAQPEEPLANVQPELPQPVVPVSSQPELRQSEEPLANVQPEVGAQPEQNRLSRVIKKGFGGTTFGDLSNSLGIGSTIASVATSDANISGGLGVGGGLGVLLGGASQIIKKDSTANVVKGITNSASGLSGIASGVSGIVGSSNLSSILGRISGGTWGVAEAINFIQKANSIYHDPRKPREYIHALNSLLKISAGVLVVSSSATGVLIAASVLGGLGATSSVIVGLHKLYEIYQSGRDPDEEVDLEAQNSITLE